MSESFARVLGPMAALPLVLALGATGWLVLGIVIATAATALGVIALGGIGRASPSGSETQTGRPERDAPFTEEEGCHASRNLEGIRSTRQSGYSHSTGLQTVLRDQFLQDVDGGVDVGRARMSAATSAARAAKRASVSSACTASASPASRGSITMPAPSSGDARGVVGLVGEHREHGDGHALGEGAAHGPGAAVADHRRRVAQDVGLWPASARRARWPAAGRARRGRGRGRW